MLWYLILNIWDKCQIEIKLGHYKTRKNVGYFCENASNHRDSTLRTDLMKTLSSTWSSISSCKMEQEVNEVVFASSNPSWLGDKLKKNLCDGFKLVNDHVKKAVKLKEDLIDLETELKSLKITK